MGGNSNNNNNIAPRINHSQQLQQNQQKITKIVTSKEWVLPPRPKPGRKPSIDTPSTKRKAQNRALQRLFRERRANRVGELEDKILEIEKERSIKEGLMNNHIKNLSMENTRLKKKIEELNKKLESASNSNKTSPLSDDDPQRTVNYISPISSSASSPNNVGSSASASSSSTTASSSSALSSTTASSTTTVIRQSGDCNVCMKDDCLCEKYGIKNVTGLTSMDNFKPIAAVPLKKRKRDDNDDNDDKNNDNDDNELDFTDKFKPMGNKFKKMPDLNKLNLLSKVALNQGDLFSPQQQVPLQQHQPLRLVEEEENCGFCSDDTPCVCRELAKEVENLNKMNEMLNREIETNLPPLKNISRHNSLPVLHPGPSVEFNKTTTTTTTNSPTPRKQSVENNNSGGCTGNPGTCSQCQIDPMSTLFCTTILNKEEKKLLSEQKKIGGDNNNNDVFISTADAYKTLSRHENFNLVNFNTLIGKLTTRGMLVEAGSVAGVLRELDRKFSCSQ